MGHLNELRAFLNKWMFVLAGRGYGFVWLFDISS